MIPIGGTGTDQQWGTRRKGFPVPPVFLNRIQSINRPPHNPPPRGIAGLVNGVTQVCLYFAEKIPKDK
jgi:hypothetical protein